MIKKAVTVLALCVAAATYAQENAVYSANIVGFQKTDVPAGLQIVGMQFDNDKTTVKDIFGDTLPEKTEVMVFDGLKYNISTYTKVFVPGGQGLVLAWSNPDLDLSIGEAFWINAPQLMSLTTSGSVPLDDKITVQINEGLQLVSYPYPVETTVGKLNLTPNDNDEIMVYNGSTYEISTYCKVFEPGSGHILKWTNPDLVIKAGQGFWYKSSSDMSWVVNRPFDIK